jgi:hypothetical protein
MKSQKKKKKKKMKRTAPAKKNPSLATVQRT